MVAKVLIVDDDPLMCDVMADALAAHGIDCSFVHSGVDAIHLLPDQKPDLIVLDCAMPGKSGLEVLRHLRAQPRFEDVPVVMASARKSPLYQEAMIAEGARAYFTKPLDLSTFGADILKLLAA